MYLDATSPFVTAVQDGSRPVADLLAADWPLIEGLAETDDVLATFLWQGEAAAVHLYGIGSDQATLQIATPMQRLDGTEVWTKTYQVPADLHTVYAFIVDDAARLTLDDVDIHGDMEEASHSLLDMVKTLRPDPRNARRLTMEMGDVTATTSIVIGPAAGDPDRFNRGPDIPAGSLEEHQVHSDLLGDSRRVWLYTPTQTPADTTYGLLVVLDGQSFVNEPDQRMVTMLDQLHAQGSIRPTVVIFVDSGGLILRTHDLDLNDTYADFLATELLQWVGERRHISAEPMDRAITGASAGGTATMLTGLRAPAAYGTLLALSPWLASVREDDTFWLITQYAQATDLPPRIRIDIGVEETLQVPHTQRLEQLLQGRVQDLQVNYYSGGHNHAGWLEALHRGLQDTFAATDRR